MEVQKHLSLIQKNKIPCALTQLWLQNAENRTRKYLFWIQNTTAAESWKTLSQNLRYSFGCPHPYVPPHSSWQADDSKSCKSDWKRVKAGRAVKNGKNTHLFSCIKPWTLDEFLYKLFYINYQRRCKIWLNLWGRLKNKFLWWHILQMLSNRTVLNFKNEIIQIAWRAFR